ncbi:MAG TPA: hypothetical protein PK025_02625 [Spirochaetales bacterium]|nr:hypothetical protein [Spirochaetales bacterium]
MINISMIAELFHFNPLLFFGLYFTLPVAILKKNSIRLLIMSSIISCIMNIFWIYIAIPLNVRPLYIVVFVIIYLLVKFLSDKLDFSEGQTKQEYLIFEIPFLFILSALSLQTTLQSFLLIFISIIGNIVLYLLLFILTEKMVAIFSTSKIEISAYGLPIRLIVIAFWCMLFINFGNILLNIP